MADISVIHLLHIYDGCWIESTKCLVLDGSYQAVWLSSKIFKCSSSADRYYKEIGENYIPAKTFSSIITLQPE